MHRNVTKIAPHTGQGANCAMEDAASLSNTLQNYLSTRGKSESTQTQHLDSLLDLWNSDRKSRMQYTYHSAHFAMRLHAREGLLNRLLGRYYLPYSGDLPADRASAGIAGGVTLKYIPQSTRSGPGWERFRAISTARSPTRLVIVLFFLMMLMVAFARNKHYV